MTGADPFTTQPDASGSVVAELAAAGFADAVEIGRGGFGIVYRCSQSLLDRVVAVKVLTADLDEDNRARFLREQRAAGKLTGHPNIVHILHAGTTGNGRPYLVMPYFPRGSLAVRIRDSGPVPLPDALRLGVKMAGALDTAHRAGILHRDVKPANILLTGYDEPILVDFGIAHVAGAFVTDTGIVTGTPAFTAPEVLSGAQASAAADVYALGATLFAALTGHAAFERRSGEQLVAQFLRITSAPGPDLSSDDIPADVAAAIGDAMAGEPGDRPSAAALGERLQAAEHRHGFAVDEMVSSPVPETGAAPPPAEVPLVRVTGPRQLRPAARTTRRVELPVELNSFVGRRTELAAVHRALSGARVVTLTGIGGVGKTRVAVRVAADAKDQYADGVAFVPLGELSDRSQLTGAVASALGVRGRAALPLPELLTDYLGDRNLLLVLDNCEHLVAAVAEFAAALLRACPALRILATSREPIGVDGEAVVPIPPLAVPDPDGALAQATIAMLLFAERAAVAVAGFELTDDNRAVIARICRRLDGLPLAIELATVWLRSMTPDQLAQRLSDRFTLLTRSPRSSPPRQQTLRLCMDWSYELCTPDEQRLWAELSVFAGSFDLDAALAVCGEGRSEAELLYVLSLLVDKSILMRVPGPGEVRFRMLDTVRDFGRDTARRTGGYVELCRRHRRWYEQLVVDANADWVGPRQLGWVLAMTREEPNLRQALEFCLRDSPESGIRIAAAVWPFWFCGGSLDEGRRWLDRLLAADRGPLTVGRATVVYADCLLAAVQADLPAVTARVGEARAMIGPDTDRLCRAHVDFAEGTLAVLRGDPTLARRVLGQAIAVYAERGNVLFQVDALTTLGLAYELEHDHDRATEVYRRALEITDEHGETMYRSYVLWSLAVTEWRQGYAAQAMELLAAALRASHAVADKMSVCMCLHAMAWIAAEHGDTERAVVLTAAAERVGGSVGMAPMIDPSVRVHLADCERRARRALDEQAYAAARRAGGAMDFDTAVGYALGTDEPVDADRAHRPTPT
ncbi:protein kinase [Nocardia asteroides NBRC 15531]|uniref:Serine/threonine protein kinase n=1 Tax=Nocardia asteroides NBRC 15531 TaxID=1110697 RepID=U5E3D7_NOCAS|nr:protein kinase [Nocardia asteroides]TLF66623.1 protein kinase [Nocardia asteroides NBRC 15531]GAD82352.1 putative serine/threonine protein kinase [Nocardia asteroides NBRC 15531]SFM96441.1 non-specific serine/threonine protein kinase [Nocardia asteroides]VEG34923.1 Serine/threonine-protein kinase pknK [Nocardia asteroides]